MNTTNATNATPAAPLTPEPPECCPACGEFLVDSKSYKTIIFVCGQVMNLLDDEWKPNMSWECVCERAFSAAVTLRARVGELEKEMELDQLENHRLLSEIIALRAELAEAKRYSAHLEHESAALAVLHSNAVDERNAALARALQAETQAESLLDENIRLLKVVGDYTNLASSLTARLAELQAVVDAAVKYSNAHHFEVGNGYKFYCVDKQADDEFDAALAALASGAVVEGGE